ncbi:MAG: lactonase family protein [Armatimonadota bacterium]
MRRALLALLLLLVGTMSGNTAPTKSSDRPLVFITSFAAGGDGAIHAFRLDPSAGTLTPARRNGGVEHPFFLALSPDRRFLYSIHARQFGGSDPEEVAAYAVDRATGELTLLNRQSSRGTSSCYLEVDATGKTVLVANYSTGSVAALPVRGDGSLGEAASFVQHAGAGVNPQRQEGPHAHCIVRSPDNRFAFAADLGLDQVVSYRLDAGRAKLTPGRQPFARTPAGAGPRHLTFHPNGRFVYVINELANSVTRFDYDPKTGFLIERQTISTLPADFDRTSHCADLKITPDGRFLYGTNRGDDSIAVYRIAENGDLTLVEIRPGLGAGPQNLALVGGKLLLCANMPGNNVAVFRIDPKTGRLTPVGAPMEVKSPSCIQVVE